MVAGLKLYLLGSPRLELNGITISIGRRKAMALLAYLVVTSRSQQRDALLAILWPLDDTQRARANLRRDLSSVRKIIGPNAIGGNQQQLQFVADTDLWVDLLQFRFHLSQHEQHDHPNNDLCPDCLQHLEAAVSLYAGDFMAGFGLPDCAAFDNWQSLQSGNLQHELTTMLTRLIDTCVAGEQIARAIPSARRLLTLDPFNEQRQRQLIKLLAQSGQSGAALGQFEKSKVLLANELAVEPEADTIALVQQIQDGQIVLSQSKLPAIASSPPRGETPRHNLPSPGSPFVGRKEELLELAELVADPAKRLISIVGPGGMGKTRLALAFARENLSSTRFPNGIHFVALAPLSDPDHIAAAMAEAFGLPLDVEGQHRRTPKRQVLDYLSGKKLLLLLDNCEHLLAGIELVNDILRVAPAVQVLTTSRERLRLQTENLYLVRGLQFPDWETPEDVAAYTAVQLFLQGARRVQTNFELSEDDLTYMSRICRLVEGMPLAVEIAAGWVDTLSIREIADEIKKGIDFLETDLRDIPERQRSIRAVFDSTWRRLDRNTQTVFSQLSVFRGGFNRQAVEAVTGASARTLSNLVNISLLNYDRSSNRYHIHELVRQYGAAKLDEDDQARIAAAEQHSDYYSGTMADWGEAFKGAGQITALAAMELDIENCRSAFDWAIQRGSVNILEGAIFTLGVYFEWQGQVQDGLTLFERLVNRFEGSERSYQSLLARSLIWKSVFQKVLGEPVAALVTIERARTHSFDPDVLAETLWRQGQILQGRDSGRARDTYLAALEQLVVSENSWLEARVQLDLGNTYWNIGQTQNALQSMQKSLLLGEALEDWHLQYSITALLSAFSRQKASRELGLHYAERCLEIAQRLNNELATAVAQSNLAATIGEYFGQFEKSLAMQQESLASLEEIGYQFGLYVGHHRLGMLLLGFDDIDGAIASFEKAEQHVRASGVVDQIANIFLWQGLVQIDTANHARAHKMLEQAYLLAYHSGSLNFLLHVIPELAYIVRHDIGEQSFRRYLLSVSAFVVRQRFATRLLTSTPHILREIIIQAESMDEVNAALLTRLAGDLNSALATYSPVEGQLKNLPKYSIIVEWRKHLSPEMEAELQITDGAEALLAVTKELLSLLPTYGWPSPEPLDYEEIAAVLGVDLSESTLA